MGYIPTNIVPQGVSADKQYTLYAPDMGLCLDSRLENTERRCSKEDNVISGTGCIKSRPMFITSSSLEQAACTYHGKSERAFMGSMIFHIGTSVYRFNGEDESLYEIFNGIDDSPSIMCEFSSKLYIYCNARIFAVDKDFICTEQVPHSPHMFNVGKTGIVTKLKPEDGAVFNLAAPRITVIYEFNDSHNFVFPIPCDTTREVVIKRNGVALSPSKYTLTEKSFKTLDFGEIDDLTVEYYFQTDSDKAEYNTMFFGCTKCISYGGNDIGGTRIFVSGNPDKKGEYCKSLPLDPLYFPMNETETIGDGCDDITGFLKVYGYLMIFTERSVYRMSYSLREDGGFFSIKHINDTAGCDVPKSICLCDNRAVFANSRQGLFIVEHEDVSGIQNVRPISGNINLTEDSQNGLLSLPRSQLTQAKCACLGEKYYLLCQDSIYIWDFGRCSYLSSGSYDKSQGRLIWHLWKQEGLCDLFEVEGKLFAISTSGGFRVKRLGKDGEKAYHSQSSFTTMHSDLGTPFSKKYITSGIFDIYCDKQSTLTLSLYGDGEKYHTQAIIPTADKRVRFEVALPSKALYSFAVEISCSGGGFEFYGSALKLKYV